MHSTKMVTLSLAGLLFAGIFATGCSSEVEDTGEESATTAPTADEATSEEALGLTATTPRVCAWEQLSYGGRASCWYWKAADERVVRVTSTPDWCSSLGCLRDNTARSAKIYALGRSLGVTFHNGYGIGQSLYRQTGTVVYTRSLNLPTLGSMNGLTSSIRITDYPGDGVDATSCTVGGTYCGGDKVKGDTTALYRCGAGDEYHGASGSWAAFVKSCANGCAVNVGKNDACK